MKLEVEIKKWHVATLIFLIFLDLGFIAVNAYNSQGNSSVQNAEYFGHSADEINIIDDTGSQVSLRDFVDGIVQNEISGSTINCSSLVFDTLTPGFGATQNLVYTLPQGCYEESGCVIKQEIHHKTGGLIALKQFDFNQDTISGIWYSSYRSGGNYINGDIRGTDIVPPLKTTPNGVVTYHLRILDDYNNAVGEITKQQIFIQDKSGNYAMKVYLCTY